MIAEPTTHALTLSTDEQTVEIGRIETPNGERLLLSGDNATTRLDAMALESLTWQDNAFFAQLTGNSRDDHELPEDTTPEFKIGNEFTFVELTHLETAAGDRLIIASPKLGYTCQCTPSELDAITRKEIEFFSALLEMPFGPESDHHGAH